ncbi:MAG: fructosamine kinase family protein [Bacteroidales bacterium]|nr:fructosamine kinase family protein [Bacteroidales bacterium]
MSKIHTKTGPEGDYYRCEANSLNELARADVLMVAKVVSFGTDFISTVQIESRKPSSQLFSKFGKLLAKLHKYKSSQYGFWEDNFIGATPQLNIANGTEMCNWADFFFNKRLLFQYLLAEKNNLTTYSINRGFLKIESNISSTLNGMEEEGASLLHGDLWYGNFICNTEDNAVLIDPAVYYGHRETDLAMCRLFGGFTSDFFISYDLEYPLLPGWREREKIYKLYHLMNHLNLFGRSYLSSVEECIGSIQ